LRQIHPEGRSNRILILLAEPFQTKYPPLWPLAFAWIMLPAFVAPAWQWFQRWGFGPSHAHCCARLSLSALLVWHFPPNNRFLLPLFPLLLPGLATELSHLAAMIRAGCQDGTSSRSIGVALASGVASITCVGAAFDWIAGRAPAGSF